MEDSVQHPSERPAGSTSPIWCASAERSPRLALLVYVPPHTTASVTINGRSTLSLSRISARVSCRESFGDDCGWRAPNKEGRTPLATARAVGGRFADLTDSGSAHGLTSHSARIRRFLLMLVETAEGHARIYSAFYRRDDSLRVQRDQEARTQIDRAPPSAGTCRAPERLRGGRVVFVPRGFPAIPVRRRPSSTEGGQRRQRRCFTTTEVSWPGRGAFETVRRTYHGCGGCRFRIRVRTSQLPAKHAWVSDSAPRASRHRRPAARARSSAVEQVSTTPQQEWSNSVRAPRVRLPDARAFIGGGRWDEVLSASNAWLADDRTSAPIPATRSTIGRAKKAPSPPTTRRPHEGYPRPPSRVVFAKV